MFTCLCSEKYGQVGTNAIGLKFFTGSYQIDANGNVVCDDRLHNIDPPKPKIVEHNDDDLFDFFEQIKAIKPVQTKKKKKSKTVKKKHKKK